MLVQQILESKDPHVVTISPQASVLEAAQELKTRNIGAVVVASSDGRVVGILSERDIARAVADRAVELASLKVADLMTAAVITCQVEQSLDDLMRLMTNHRIRHLPIVQGQQLIGIISIGDVVKHRMQQLEEETSALREYIVS